MLETASSKIDRFGWGNMDEALKDSLCGEWCEVLSPYRLDEVRQGIKAVFDAAKGKLRSINEFQVKAEIQKEHARIVAALPRAAAPEPIAEITEAEREHRAKVIADAMNGFGHD
jgi:isocitrate lyase